MSKRKKPPLPPRGPVAQGEGVATFGIPDVTLVYQSDWACLTRRGGSIYFGFGQTTPSGRLISGVVLRMNRDTANEIARVTASMLANLDRQVGAPAELGEPDLLDQPHLSGRVAHDRASLMTVTYVGPEAELCVHRLAVGPLQSLTRADPNRSPLALDIAVPVMRVELPTAVAHSVLHRLAREVSEWQ